MQYALDEIEKLRRNLASIQLTPGPAGTALLNGTTVPSNSLGSDGDFYLRTTTQDVYLKTAGLWSLSMNIKGATGETGATGATGPQGPARYCVFSASADNSQITGTIRGPVNAGSLNTVNKASWAAAASSSSVCGYIVSAGNYEVIITLSNGTTVPSGTQLDVWLYEINIGGSLNLGGAATLLGSMLTGANTATYPYTASGAKEHYIGLGTSNSGGGLGRALSVVVNRTN